MKLPDYLGFFYKNHSILRADNLIETHTGKNGLILSYSRRVNQRMSHCLKHHLLRSLITTPLIFCNSAISKSQLLVK